MAHSFTGGSTPLSLRRIIKDCMVPCMRCVSPICKPSMAGSVRRKSEVTPCSLKTRLGRLLTPPAKLRWRTWILPPWNRRTETAYRFFAYRMTDSAAKGLISWCGKLESRFPMRKRNSTDVDYIRKHYWSLKDWIVSSSRFVHWAGCYRPDPAGAVGVVLCMGPLTIRLTKPSPPDSRAYHGQHREFKTAKMGVLLHQPLLAASGTVFPKGLWYRLLRRGDCGWTSHETGGRVFAFIAQPCCRLWKNSTQGRTTALYTRTWS